MSGFFSGFSSKAAAALFCLFAAQQLTEPYWEGGRASEQLFYTLVYSVKQGWVGTHGTLHWVS